MTSTATTTRRVTSTVTGSVSRPSRLVVSMAVAEETPRQDESFVATVGDAEVAHEAVAAPYGTRLHLLREVPAGNLRIEYGATVTGDGVVPVGEEIDRITMQRPSRYCPSEMFQALADAEFGRLEGTDLLRAVARRVNEAVVYDGTQTRVTDTSLDTWLRRTGVCRDFTHVVISFLRARNIPARLASVYAPGLVPMDFHAIVEAWVDDGWWIVDATRLAPRPSMVRIATGRDAADTAFMTVLDGGFRMGSMQVTATIDEGLPNDLVTDLVELR
jgi:transglutaminase-like putative cysteine protease